MNDETTNLFASVSYVSAGTFQYHHQSNKILRAFP